MLSLNTSFLHSRFPDSLGGHQVWDARLSLLMQYFSICIILISLLFFKSFNFFFTVVNISSEQGDAQSSNQKSEAQLSSILAFCLISLQAAGGEILDRSEGLENGNRVTGDRWKWNTAPIMTIKNWPIWQPWTLWPPVKLVTMNVWSTVRLRPLRRSLPFPQVDTSQ